MSINSKPQTIFTTETIADPAVRQNFDILNKQIQGIYQNKRQQAANIVFGEPNATTITADSTGATTGGGYPSVSISTRGNPVQLSVAAGLFNINYPAGSRFLISNTSDQGAVTFGWKRVGNGSVKLLTAIQMDVLQGYTSLPFPCFEFQDDDVPSGTWTYTFGFPAIVAFGGSTTSLTITWARLIAREIR